MMSIVFIVAAVALAASLIWLARRWRDSGQSERIARCALDDFNRHLSADIIAKRRPIGDLVLTRLMCDIVESLSAAQLGAGQAALVEPPDDGYRRACEELVVLGRLKRDPSGAYVPVYSESFKF